jgi:hypothetical protein
MPAKAVLGLLVAVTALRSRMMRQHNKVLTPKTETNGPGRPISLETSLSIVDFHPAIPGTVASAFLETVSTSQASVRKIKPAVRIARFTEIADFDRDSNFGSITN